MWQGAIRVFRGRHQCRRSAPNASRHRYPPRDLVNSRTARKVEATAPGPADATRRSLRHNVQAGSWKKTRGRWRRRQGAARTRRERCLWKIPRYSPLRELATARRQTLPREEPAAWSATRSAMKLCFGSLSISLQRAADPVSAGVSTRSIALARCPVEAKRRVGRGVGCGRGPSAFFEGGTNAAGAPRMPAVIDPRRAISWTPRRHERWRRRPRSGGRHPVLPPAQRPGRLLEKDARQVEASARCRAYTAGKVFAEDSAILTVAGACDGTAADLAR
jgi:hypothetical protein